MDNRKKAQVSLAVSALAAGSRRLPNAYCCAVEVVVDQPHRRVQESRGCHTRFHKAVAFGAQPAVV